MNALSATVLVGARATALIAVAALSACTGQPSESSATERPAATARDAASTQNPAMAKSEPNKSPRAESEAAAHEEVATFAAGCFWCVEAVLERVKGVRNVQSGYMGGTTENPTYEQVCTGRTGHAEAVQVTYDPAQITYEELLGWFWHLHDPTTLDRQGNDVGTQYRSVIFVHDAAQRAAAEKSKKEMDASGEFASRIVTEIVDAGRFWPAEDYHQDYFRLNPTNGYCRAVIPPKLRKLGLDGEQPESAKKQAEPK